MNKHYEDSLEKANEKIRTFNFDKDSENGKNFVFITHFGSLEVIGINENAQKYFKTEIQALSEKEVLFEKIIEPTFYKKFLAHIEGLQLAADLHSKEMVLPLINQKGKARNFILKTRFYAGNSISRQPYFISFAKEIEQIDKIKASTLSSTIKKRKRHQSVLQSIKDGFCIIELVFDLKGNPIDYIIVETNPAFETQLKITGAVGKSIRELESEKDNYWLEEFAEVARTGNPFFFENYNENLDESWFDVSALPMGQEEKGKLALVFSNITSHKLTEQKLNRINASLEEKVLGRTKQLQDNAKFLQNLFDTAHTGIIIYKPVYDKNREIIDFQYERVNQVIIDQYERNDLVGSFFTDINPHEPDFGVFAALKRTFLTGEKADFEVFYDLDGYNNWFRIITTKQNDYLITSLEDITHRKRESEKLRESVRFIKQLAKTSPDVIMLFNLYEEKISFISRDLASKPGMKKKDILGMNLLDILPFIHPLEREKAMGFHHNIIASKSHDIVEIEFRLKGKKQTWEWFNARGKVFMRTKKGKVCEYIVLLRNINEQKKTQKALLDAEKLSIKGEVARTLAHELRNPIASIGMATDILLDDNGGTKKDKEAYIKIIKKSTKTLNQLVTDLLSLSNYTEAIFKKICLSKVLEDTLKMAEDRIYLAGIKVIKNYKKGYFISADIEKLKIALLNIIVNASEAMEPDEGILHLSINKDNDKVCLCMEDNGCGIDKEQQHKLFDSFYTQKAGGMGIGLSSVKTILEEHDAVIKVKSEPKKGTAFTITFHYY